MSMDSRLVFSRRPLPQDPETGVADLSSAPMIGPVSPLRPLPELAVALGPVTDDSTEEGRSATVSQSLPTVYALPGLASPVCFVPPPSDCCCTVAPAGGLNAKLAAAGLTNEIEVNPIWTAGLFAPFANTCTRSGTSRVPSTAMRIWPTRDWELLGASTSW